jgi:hypothetical protein
LAIPEETLNPYYSSNYINIRIKGLENQFKLDSNTEDNIDISEATSSVNQTPLDVVYDLCYLLASVSSQVVSEYSQFNFSLASFHVLPLVILFLKKYFGFEFVVTHTVGWLKNTAENEQCR